MSYTALCWLSLFTLLPFMPKSSIQPEYYWAISTHSRNMLRAANRHRFSRTINDTVYARVLTQPATSSRLGQWFQQLCNSFWPENFSISIQWQWDRNDKFRVDQTTPIDVNLACHRSHRHCSCKFTCPHISVLLRASHNTWQLYLAWRQDLSPFPAWYEFSSMPHLLC